MTKTAQEVFDEVIEHLFKQGKQAIDALGTCQYRAPDGSKCAVGALIPDDKYTASLEGALADDVKIIEILPEEYREHRALLRALQCFHDHSWTSLDQLDVPRLDVPYWYSSNDGFMGRLHLFAEKHGLSTAKFEGRTFVPFREREKVAA